MTQLTLRIKQLRRSPLREITSALPPVPFLPGLQRVEGVAIVVVVVVLGFNLSHHPDSGAGTDAGIKTRSHPADDFFFKGERRAPREMRSRSRWNRSL